MWEREYTVTGDSQLGAHSNGMPLMLALMTPSLYVQLIWQVLQMHWTIVLQCCLLVLLLGQQCWPVGVTVDTKASTLSASPVVVVDEHVEPMS